MIRDVLAALPALRAAANALMTSTWRITQLGDPAEDGYTLTRPETVVYEGIGKLQTYEGHEQSAVTGGGTATVVVQRMTLHVPVGPYRPQVGHVAECVTSTDPLLVGRRFRITQGYPVKEHATAYRAFVDEIAVQP